MIGATIVGLQETKYKSSGSWCTSTWAVFSSAAAGAVGGCQLWLCRGVFDQLRVAVLSSSLRHPFVAISGAGAGTCDLDVIVLYALRSEPTKVHVAPGGRAPSPWRMTAVGNLPPSLSLLT